jgi:hypothetical protein
MWQPICVALIVGWAALYVLWRIRQCFSLRPKQPGCGSCSSCPGVVEKSKPLVTIGEVWKKT